MSKLAFLSYGHKRQKKAYDKSQRLAISVNFRILQDYSPFSGLKPTSAVHKVLELYFKIMKLTFAVHPWSSIAT